jgi:23S rRNA pseudouridine1911/1915/1917 synthase
VNPARTETIKVEQTLPSERLDKFLCAYFPVVSRGTIQRLIEEGEIRVNGQQVKPTHHPHAGEEILVHWPDARPAEAQPEEMPLEIVYEDEHLLVVNKAVGVVVHPAAGHEGHTLVNALLHHCKGQLSGIGGVARPGIVHRLDRDTSGCLVVAKNDATHLGLSAQFAERHTEKSYQALVCGVVPDDTGDIRAAIARHPSHRKRMAVRTGSSEGRDSWTSYRVLERLTHATLLEAGLHTGRTHQIRVHFQHLGFPIVGDTTYGKRQNVRLTELTNYTAGRQMLHSWKLTFTHPAREKKMTFTAPLPPDFEAALKALRADV